MKLCSVIARCVLLAVLPVATMAPGQSNQHWVATWGTAQQMVRVPGVPGLSNAARGPATPGPGRNQANGNPSRQQQGPLATVTTGTQNPASVGAAMTPAPTVPGVRRRRFGIPPPIDKIDNQTVRMIVRSSIGGQKVRVRFSNALATTTVPIGAAHIALRAADSGIVPSSDRVLTFSGKPTANLYAGEVLLSDPVDLAVPPLTDLTISIYVPANVGPPTSHGFGLRSTYVSTTGDVSGSASIQSLAATMLSYYWLAGVDVLAPADAGTVVAFGDSITDGDQSTPDTNHMWPAVLAARLQGKRETRNLGLVNAGIAGNRILGDNNSGLTRFYHDALNVPGVKWVVLLEGINDINFSTRPPANDAVPAPSPTPFSADSLIAAYRQVIEMAHLQGVRVVGCTITPSGAAPDSRGEIIRLAVNEWIRTSGAFDAVVDFDATTRDPADPHRFRAAVDSPDLLHPGDDGYKMMADSIDLSLFSNTKQARHK